jgi:hypothetical protein
MGERVRSHNAVARETVPKTGIKHPPCLGGLVEGAVGDKGLVFEAKLAEDDGVGAAARQLDQAQVALRIGALVEEDPRLPHPVFPLGGRQLVEVEHRFPRALLALAILLQRRPPPHAAHVLSVPTGAKGGGGGGCG